MAVFFTRETVDQAVQEETLRAEAQMTQQVKQDETLRTAWEQHAKTCDAAEGGLVLIESPQESGRLYGDGGAVFGCSCQQILYTVDDKGNLKMQTTLVEKKQDAYMSSPAYLKGKSLYSQKS